MSVVLELGPGDTFLFDSPGGTTTNHLPEGLKDLEAGVGEGRSIQAIYSLSFGCNGAYVLAARNVNGAIIRRNNLPPQLESWLIDPVSHTCKRDIATLSVEFGPNNSFYARDKDSYRWHNLPDALEEAIQQRLSPAGWMARPDFVVLGADGAFIYSNDCGGCSHALGNYPKLQEFVLNLQRSNIGGLTGFALMQCVSMSIDRPGYFVALDNAGRYAAEVSPDAAHALNTMAGTFPVLNPRSQPPQQRSVSQPIMHQHSPPPLSPSSPPPMYQATLPTRKPVGSGVVQPQTSQRPQVPHLVPSPTPQSQPIRPTPYHQASAPAVPQAPAQSSARPMSMQTPPQTGRVNTPNRTSMNLKAFGKIASAVKDTTNRFSNSQQHQQQQNNATVNSNYNYNYNYNSNATYSNPNANTNSGGTTYVVAGDSGTTQPYAPTYVVDNDSSTTNVDTTSVYSTTVDSTNIYNPTVDSSTNPTFDNNSINNISTIYDTTTSIDTTQYNVTSIDTASVDNSTIDTTVVDSSVVDDTITTTATGNSLDLSSGDSGSGGFWSSLIS